MFFIPDFIEAYLQKRKEKKELRRKQLESRHYLENLPELTLAELSEIAGKPKSSLSVPDVTTPLNTPEETESFMNDCAAEVTLEEPVVDEPKPLYDVDSLLIEIPEPIIELEKLNNFPISQFELLFDKAKLNSLHKLKRDMICTNGSIIKAGNIAIIDKEFTQDPTIHTMAYFKGSLKFKMGEDNYFSFNCEMTAFFDAFEPVASEPAVDELDQPYVN